MTTWGLQSVQWCVQSCIILLYEKNRDAFRTKGPRVAYIKRDNTKLQNLHIVIFLKYVPSSVYLWTFEVKFSQRSVSMITKDKLAFEFSRNPVWFYPLDVTTWPLPGGSMMGGDACEIIDLIPFPSSLKHAWVIHTYNAIPGSQQHG